MNSDKATGNKPLLLRPGEGRVYPMGRMSAIFKADGDETNSRLSVSEWWLEPNTEGPHIHFHPEDHLIYVLEGTMSVYLEAEWVEVEKGTYVYIPGGSEHSFENRGSSKAGFMNINTPGGFESAVPHIVEYFKDSPLGDAGT